jgi:hypothetical protein
MAQRKLVSLLWLCATLVGCADRTLSNLDELGNGGNQPDASVAPSPDAPPGTVASCTPLQEWKGTCVCTAETCAPGSTRWCDGPVYCDWGVQTCGPDGAWGTCVESTVEPPGCNSRNYDIDCCLAADACCESIDPRESTTSLGNCPGLVQTCHNVE